MSCPNCDADLPRAYQVTLVKIPGGVRATNVEHVQCTACGSVIEYVGVRGVVAGPK